MMRLFVAIAPPADALSELEQAVAPLRPDWPRLRWVGQERWHVTLAFLGTVDEGRLDGLRTRLGRAAGRHGSAEVRIGAGGAFPSAAKARVLCAHLDGQREELAGLGALAASVAAGARRAGAPAQDEGRRYRPHVTLARSRETANLSALVEALRGFKGSAWQADRIHLILSHTGPRPSYQTIASWPLRSGSRLSDSA
jgi:2'-5' RNA ligase